MQRILLLLSLLIPFAMNAQPGNNYDELWAKVKAAGDKGLTKTASNQVMAIYRQAEKENNYPQVIKAAIYRIQFRNETEEESEKTNYFFLDTLLAGSRAPAKNILYSIQAEMLWSYLQQNRWRFYNRTALVEEKFTDITTWSIAKMNNTISALYKKSLENTALLKQTRVDQYEAILLKGQNARYLRPTLYDLLAHRALDYLSNDERNIAQPAYAFKIEQPEAFSPAAEFAKLSLKTKDTASLHYKALLIYQELLSFHLNDAQPDALIDADISRLRLVNRYSTITGKEKMYEQALKNIEEKYSASSASAQAGYLRALMYSQRGADYNPLTKTDNQYEIKRAKELAEAIVKKYPKSEGAINSANLLAGIKRPSLNMETEVVNVPAQPFRMLVTYKNIPKLYFRIIKTSHEELKEMNRRNSSDPWAKIIAMKTVKQWSVVMPDPGDFQQHSVELKIDALDKGTYMLAASLDAGFSLKENILAREVFYVSNIAYIKKGDDYHVLHRETGQPLKKATVQAYELRYDYNTYEEQEIKAEKYTANDNGLFTLARKKESHNYIFDVRTADDQLFMDGRQYGSVEYDANGQVRKDYRQSFLFTDRGIYRPGQTVYFKGILVNTAVEASKTSVVPDAKVTIQLKDANWQKVSEVNLTTNEYGSYNGTFRLPEGLLTGQFALWDSANNKQVYFNVEEYKRPKFFTEIKQPKGSYRVNDSIKVTGTVKAYAGNNIDGAKVKYRVVRKVQMPWWYGYGFGRYMWPTTGNQPMEITNGETVTNAKGEFTVTFKAIPDETVKKENQPIFNYEVIADVTDLNGETRSGSINVPVSYQALQLNITLADKMVADSLKNIAISSTNINGSFEKATVQVSVYKLKSPGRFFRSRYWQQPDQFVMSRDEYYGYFPYDIYKNENEPSTWEKGDRVTDAAFTTEENKKFNLNTSFTPGWYVIELNTKDKYGETVKAVKYFELTPLPEQVAAYTSIDIASPKPMVEPGAQATYHIATSFKEVFIIHHQQFMQNKEGKTMYEQLSNGVKTVSLPVTENDRGGIGVSAYFVKYNRVFGEATQFNIPWSNKQLNITFETFRDKTLPGSKEEYKVKISGAKGEKLGAEMLAAMYDASLDQFRPQYWENLSSLFPGLYYNSTWSEAGNFAAVNSQESNYFDYDYASFNKVYDRIIGSYKEYGGFAHDMSPDVRFKKGEDVMGDWNNVPSMAAPPSPEAANEVVVVGYGNKAKSAVREESKKTDDVPVQPPAGNENVQVRKNFNETAFFFPDLKTDAEGNIVFSYTIPEALTEWKLMALAHTKDMASGYETKKVVTQKPLMVQPNAPRFLREGDNLELVAKVVNLTDKEITGTAELQLIDPETGKPVDGWFKNVFPNQYFTVAAGQSTAVPFTMDIPFNYNKPVTYRVIAKSKDASDGEENILPVVTNRMLVTETLPLPMRGSGTKNFTFDKLLKSGGSGTLTNHAITVEYTSNPAWYAVQALPYLMEYPYECAEQTFNRFYANALAFKIANSSPRIKAIFDKWKTIDKAALLSNLQKNEELKSALLQETPWVMAAKNEEEQKRNIGLLFDIIKMTGEMEKNIRKLAEMQTSGGAYTWFKGGPDDRYMTQYIITGIGHLKKLNAIPAKYNSTIQNMVNRGISYLDKKIIEDYDNLVRYKSNLKENNTGYIQVQYHYMRSFFPNAAAPYSKTAYDYYFKQMQQYWLKNSKYMQGMIALATYRKADSKTPAAILKSLKENAIIKEEMGMYWKDVTGGYYWHQAPIETMSLLVEAFSEAGKDTKAVDDLKTWLLKNKQTTNWKTTKATAEACYALLLEGSDFLAENPDVKIQLGSTTITPPANAEAGTGYFKQTIEGDKVKPEMGNISVSVSNTKAGQVTSWGGVYWQYFENLDKITGAETPLKLVKKLYVEKASDKGPVLQAIQENSVLHVGDKIKVRIELRVDRDMEYVHMKDMRSSGTEPVNVLSRYKWQGGLGYYESTKDASTNFFFNWLPKGTYVFEYPLFVTHKGNFSNGITTIQCMYAPEFTSHSEGVRVRVE